MLEQVELFDALRQELETPALEKASASVWDLILENNGLGKETSETVERVFFQLSGKEPSLFPHPIDESLPGKNTESGKEKGKKEKKIESKNEKSNSKSKKRSFSKMNAGATPEVARISGDTPAALDDSS